MTEDETKRAERIVDSVAGSFAMADQIVTVEEREAAIDLVLGRIDFESYRRRVGL